jgi:tRNA U34 5-methylaminomethyl-2-thiouridine-forming methyltransferase MnmC
MVDYELARSSCGAPTLRDRSTGETLHRNLGAASEARLVYAKGCRLADRTDAQVRIAPLRVADVGLGGGFNAMAAIEAALGNPMIQRLELESFDLSLNGLVCLAQNREHFFADWGHVFLLAQSALECFKSQAPAQAKAVATYQTLCPRPPGPLAMPAASPLELSWTFVSGDAVAILGVHNECKNFDAIFYDMFSWRSAPELWTYQSLASVARHLKADGVLATYSGATAIRASLLALGLFVGQGAQVAPSMRATLASPHPQHVGHLLEPAWRERFLRSQRPYLECEPDTNRHLIRQGVLEHAQFL